MIPKSCTTWFGAENTRFGYCEIYFVGVTDGVGLAKSKRDGTNSGFSPRWRTWIRRVLITKRKADQVVYEGN